MEAPTVIVILLCIVHSSTPANILAVMTVASPSHHIWNSVLTNALADRGHRITYFSPDMDAKPNKNIRYITIERLYEQFGDKFEAEVMAAQHSAIEVIQQVNAWSNLNTELIFNSKAVDKLLEIVRTEKFDLVLIDHGINEAMFGILKFTKDAPVVAATPFAAIPSSNSLVGNPESIAIWPHGFLQYPSDMSLYQRLQNVLTHVYYYLERRFVYYPEQQRLAAPKFGAFDIESLMKRTSLVIVNTHFSIDPAVPVVPGFVQAGGLQVLPPKPLPQDIQKFLDEATDGAVLFCLGSNVNSSKLSKQKLNMFLRAMARLAPLRVLWKLEKDNYLQIPANVLTRKWLPQSDILAHPNVKAFVSHSGLLSTHESLHRGKPIVAMPFFTDQHINSNRCVRDGYAIKVDVSTLTEDDLVNAVRTILDDPRYRARAEEVSKIFKDQPETPLERAVFWTEYVIRHKGAPQLRTPRQHFSWLQNHLIDVAAVLLLSLTTLFYFTVLVFRFLLRLLTSSKQKTS